MTTDDRQGSAERATPIRAPIVVAPGEGRRYPCGPMTATFLADGAETADRWSLSEWVLEPRSPGPGEHAHEGNDDAFYVLEGQVTFVVDGVDHVAGPGTLVAAPAGVRHDFRNDGDVSARFLNLYVPGGFEEEMGPIVDWYARNR